MIPSMAPADKPLAWLHGEIRTPPMSAAARLEVGFLLRRLQPGDRLEFPHSRPMPDVGPGCHELRVPDENVTWRIVYRADQDAVVILDVFAKKTPRTPASVMRACRHRLGAYDSATRDKGSAP